MGDVKAIKCDNIDEFNKQARQYLDWGYVLSSSNCCYIGEIAGEVFNREVYMAIFSHRG